MADDDVRTRCHATKQTMSMRQNVIDRMQTVTRRDKQLMIATLRRSAVQCCLLVQRSFCHQQNHNHQPTQLSSTQPEITDAGINTSMSASLFSHFLKKKH